MAAARAAHVDEFAERLPKGYDTEVGERGMTLSGGQRQRIAIAPRHPARCADPAARRGDERARCRKRGAVQEALERLTRRRTTLVIAHRLATVRNADRILVLDRGPARRAKGRHGELQSKIATRSIPRLAEAAVQLRTVEPEPTLTLRQLELDAAVARLGVFAFAGIERLELAEARRHQMLGRDALADQILDHGDGARRRQFPVRLEGRGLDRIDIGMAVDPQHPGDVGGNLRLRAR